MAFPVIRKVRRCQDVQGLTWVSPSPLLTSYCFLRGSRLLLVDVKTQEACTIDDGVRDFLWCGDDKNDRLTRLLYAKPGGELEVVSLDGIRPASRSNLQLIDIPGDFELVCSSLGCEIPVVVLLLRGETVLVGVTLKDGLGSCTASALWRSVLDSPPLLTRAGPADVFVLTSARIVVSYSLTTGCKGAVWSLGDRDPRAVVDFVPWSLESAAGNPLVLVMDGRLCALYPPAASTSGTACQVSAFLKRPAATNVTGCWQHLLDLESEAHLLVPRRGRLLFCSGTARGLRELTAFECRGRRLLPTVRQQFQEPYAALHDGRQSWRAARLPPVLFLFESSLVAPTFGISTQRLLREVMERHGAETAESLSQLNSWASSMAMDAGVLSQGIRQRQLDTIAFFLRSKEEALEAQLKRAPHDPEHCDALDKEVEEWDRILGELVGAVQGNSSQLTSRHFAQQLLQLLLHSLVRLFDITENKEQCERVQKMLCKQILAARQQLPSVAHVTCLPLSRAESLLPEASAEVLVREALLQGGVPKAQQQLREIGDPHCSLEHLREKGICMALHRIREGDRKGASTILSNLGFSPRERLHELLLGCRDAHLRSMLLGALEEYGPLNEKTRSLIQRLAVLEEAFPCNSFPNTEAFTIQGAQKNRADALEVASRGYSRLAPLWLQYWDDDVDDRILASAPRGQDSVVPVSVDSSQWSHLLESGRVDRFLSWFSVHPVPQAVTNLLATRGGIPHVHRWLLCALARKGFLSEETVEDFGELLSLLGEANLPLGAFLPGTPGAPITARDFVHRLLHYCLQHQLHLLLYVLATEFQCDLHPQCHLCNVPLVNALLSHCLWLKQPNDQRLGIRASIALAHALYGTQQPKEGGHLGTKALLGIPVPEVLRSLMTREMRPVSLYSLLDGEQPWDPARVFAWRTDAHGEGGPVRGTLPHFSEPSLAEAYGPKEELGPTYYLLRGRPCYAYFKFLAHQLSSRHTLSSTRMKGAVSLAQRTARLHFQQPSVVSACVAFLELLGQDSTALRQEVQCARLLQECLSENPHRESLVESLDELQHGKASVKTIAVLSEIILERLQEYGTSSLCWVMLLQEFALRHGLEPPRVVLLWCAGNDDWLGFLFWAQLLQFPKAHVVAAVEEFCDPCLREHLRKALLEVSSLRRTKETAARPPRNPRASLYARIGLDSAERVGSVPVSVESLSEAEVASVYSGENVDAKPQLLPDAEPKYPRELVSLLLECGSGPCAWEHLLRASLHLWSPVPCVLAACCSEAPLVSCLTLWLVTSGQRPQTDVSPFREQTLEDLRRAMLKALSEKRLHNLLLGLRIFQHGCALVPLVEFLVAYLLERKGDKALDKLHRFRDMLLKPARGGAQGLSSVSWGTSLGLDLLGASLKACRSWREQRGLLRCYALASLHQLSNAPDIALLRSLVECCPDEDLGLPLDQLWSANDHREIIRQSVHHLNLQGRFTQATAVAKAACLPLAEVTLEQADMKFKDCAKRLLAEGNGTYQWEDFWRDCDTAFLDVDLDPLRAFDFFKEKSREVTSYRDKYVAMRHALAWLDRVENPPSEAQGWHLHMWLFCIKAELEDPQGAATLLSEDLTSVEGSLLCLQTPKEDQEPLVTLADEEEAEALERLINRLLSKEQFQQARDVVSAFGHPTVDYSILTTCIQLAQGDLEVEQVDPPLLMKAMHQSVRRTSWMVSSLSTQAGQDQPRAAGADVLELLDKLCSASKHSASLCNRVLVAFRVAKVLMRPYRDVVAEPNTIFTLEELLQSGTPERFALAKELLAVNRVPQEEVVRFLFDKTLAAIKAQVYDLPLGEKTGTPGQSQGVSEDFERMLQLCQDPSELGNMLLKARRADMHSLDGDSKGLSMEVELCIRAHDCFSVCCSMEGISRALHRCHRLTPCLVSNQEFPLLVRLLTGIQRYSEMSYIFDILQENHQFELLFRKGMEKVPYLRVALLDYLKHKSSSSPDMYTMLTFNFSMHREIAETLETSALKKIKNLKQNGGASWSKEEFDVLEHVLQDLADAAESYVKADCLLRAQACARKAQLVALQMRYFTRQLPLLNLEPAEATALLVNHPKFFEAQLVSEAYGLQQSWWSGAVFFRVVQAGDWEYMKDMRAAGCELTPLHVEDIAHRYSQAAMGAAHREAMERLLEEVPCVETRLRLAQRLGFSRLVQHTLATQPYLHDIAAVSRAAVHVSPVEKTLRS